MTYYNLRMYVIQLHTLFTTYKYVRFLFAPFLVPILGRFSNKKL